VADVLHSLHQKTGFHRYLKESSALGSHATGALVSAVGTEDDDCCRVSMSALVSGGTFNGKVGTISEKSGSRSEKLALAQKTFSVTLPMIICPTMWLAGAQLAGAAGSGTDGGMDTSVVQGE
jgi:hypothetical protein